ncbi:MAG TPA: EAL domain-containing protein [Anaeromyxobacteraceae bacterium]|nr:EAL domain-containing protein [Anaeromyxobacteraceae bacterium]
MTEETWVVGRQPIVDREERVTAYELLFRTPHASSAAVGNPSLATASVVLGVLSGFGVQQILGGHRGFVNVDSDFLFGDSIELLPPDRIGLEIVETIQPTEAVVKRCRQLKELGFKLALDDHRPSPLFEPLYGIVDTAKIDLTLSPQRELAETVRLLRAYPVTLIAEKVESREQLRQCLDLGFDCFQGYYFARPSVLERRRLSDSAAILLKVLHLLLEDAETDEIDSALRHEPSLTYKLLVLLNSVSFGRREPITTVRHAITMLGRQQLRRWVQLALLASADQRGLDNPLVDAAGVRATFMEQLARHLPEPGRADAEPEQAFMVGILSFLDAIYDTSMEDLVRTLNLSDRIGDALTRREGLLGDLLRCAEEMEHLEIGRAWDQLGRLGLSEHQALEAQWRAFAWRTGTI